jgi:hypothetical protein
MAETGVGGNAVESRQGCNVYSKRIKNENQSHRVTA